MPARPILLYPDPRLKAKAEPVRVFDAALRALADDLAETLGAAPALGLAGPHVGALVRIVVLKLTPEEAVAVYVNPTIERLGADRLSHREGSVSMPGASEEVERPAEVEIAFQRLDGAPARETATGFRAACLLHEIDQLDGIFWLDRLSRLKRDRLLKRYEKSRKLRSS